MRIAIDAMGGDHAPDVVIDAVNNFSREDIELILVGKEELLKTRVNKDIKIVNAPEVIGMDEKPVQAVRSKRNSSIVIGTQLLKNGEADAFFGAGNTGAYVVVATVILGRIKGVKRPALGTFFPTEQGDYAFVIDVGANADSKPEHLYQFAIMASICAVSYTHLTLPTKA